MSPLTAKNFVIADFPPPIQGISIVSEWLAQSLEKERFEFEKLNTSVARINFYFIRRFIRLLVIFLRVTTGQSKGIVYIALSHGLTLVPQTAIIILGKIKGKRVIVHHHSFLPIINSQSITNKICHNLMKTGVEHIFLSNYMRDQYLRIWKPKERTWIITNHQVANSRIESSIENKIISPLRMVYAGRMSPEKGFWEVAQVTKDLLKESKNLHATFLGPTTNLEIENEILALKSIFKNQFEYVENYTEVEFAEILEHSTFFLFPSKYLNEASPLVVLEAQAAGNICITSQIGTLKTDVLPPGEAIEIQEWAARTKEIIKSYEINHQDLAKVKNGIRQRFQIINKENSTQWKEVFGIEQISKNHDHTN